MSETTGRTSTWAKVAYILFLIVFTLLCAEIGARYYLGHVLEKASENKFRFNYYRVYEHVPGFTESNDTGVRMTINANGFRRTVDVQQQKPDGVYRIFFLGGSAAHGISSGPPYPLEHVHDSATIDAHLERLLRDALPGQQVEVINAAVTGYQVFQHTQYLLTELLSYQPDMVIFFDGANDHFTNNPDHSYLEDLRYQYWKPRLQHPSIGSVWDMFSFWLSRYSGLFRGYVAWNFNRDAQRQNAGGDLVRPYEDDALRIAQHRLAATQQFLRSIETNLFLLHREQVKVVLSLQPMLVLRDNTLLSPAEIEFLHKDHNVEVLYPVVVQELNTIAERWNVPVIDMNIPFNDPAFGGKQLLIDYCHLNSMGGKVCAKEFLPVVKDLILGRSLQPSDSTMVKAPEGSGI